MWCLIAFEHRFISRVLVFNVAPDAGIHLPTTLFRSNVASQVP